MRDMHNEILKYGAQIVDSLKDFRQPVLVYIPPAGELRGGAWVVVDPAINPDMVEMYAAEGARGRRIIREVLLCLFKGILFRRYSRARRHRGNKVPPRGAAKGF
ncbi:hypothetical protein Zmor_003981 [Zophobas morio]|jgi:hypothetical protein|uniref:CoA carboxyltransferase C-terminal domain-containing protein n=1 Tax=Zophobas morio TaxID=2755281 RepID=A0AA38LZS9_9CUCU|nr:hypothetical protein Zmor_003981 [Zophobas morio]